MKTPYQDRKLKFETLQLHVGQESADVVTDARAVPIYQTSSYVFHNCEHAAARFALQDSGNIYGRLTNPTQDVFERRIAALEGGSAALAVASGAAAIAYTIENLAKTGDHIVSANNIYGGTYNFLAHTIKDYGVETTFVNPADFELSTDQNINSGFQKGKTLCPIYIFDQRQQSVIVCGDRHFDDMLRQQHCVIVFYSDNSQQLVNRNIEKLRYLGQKAYIGTTLSRFPF